MPSNLLIPIGGIGLFILGFVAVIKGLSWSQISVGLISWFGVIWGLQQFLRWWERKRRQYQQDYQYSQKLKQWQRANKVRARYLKNAHKHQQQQLQSRRQKLRHLLKGKPEFLTKSAIAKHRSLTGSGFEQSDRRFPQPTVCCQILS